MSSSAEWKPRKPGRPVYRDMDPAEDSLRSLLTRSLREMAGRDDSGGYRRAASANRQLAGALRRHLHMLEAADREGSGHYDDFVFDDYHDPRDRALERLAEESRLTRQALFVMADRLEERLSMPAPAADPAPVDAGEAEIAALRAMLETLEADERELSGDRTTRDEREAWDRPADSDPHAGRLARLEERLDDIAAALAGGAYTPESRDRSAELDESMRRIADTQDTIRANIGAHEERYRETLDERLNALAGRIEARIRQDGTAGEIGGLRRELREMSRRLSMPSADLASEIRSVAERVDSIPQHSENAFRRIADGLAEHIESSSSATISTLRADLERIHASASAAGFGTIQHAIADIATRLDTAGQAELGALRDEIAEMRHELAANGRVDLSGIGAIEQAIADISTRLDTAGQAELGALRDEIAEMRREIAANGRVDLSGIGAIEHAIADISTRLDTAGQAELGALRDEIAEMRREIETSGRIDLSGIETSLALLLRKLDERPVEPARADDTAVLEAVERRIAQLSEDIASVRNADPASSHLEPLLADLARRIDSSRAEAVEAARQVAEIAAGKAIAAPRDAAPEKALINALQNEIRQLRQSSDQSDQRTQETLEALHEVLGKIVGRLSEMEREVRAAEPHAAVPETTPHTASRAAAPMPAAPAISARERPLTAERDTPPEGLGEAPVEADFPLSLQDDVPLPPHPDEQAPAPDSRPERAPAEDGGRDKTDFIAAARRAARAAAVEEAADDIAAAPRGLGRLLRRKARNDESGIDAVIKAPAAEAPDAARSGRGRIAGLSGLAAAGGGKPAGASRRIIVYGMSIFLIVAGGWQIYRMMAAAKVPPVPSASAPQETAPAAPQPEEEPTVTDRRSSVGTPAAPRQIEIGRLPARADAAQEPAEPAAGEDAAAALPQPAFADLPSSLPQALREAAAQADMLARYEIATRYAEARDVPQDMEKAAQWFQLAAAQGHAPSQLRLGGMFEKGSGVPKDAALARIWYERAAEGGNRRAMHNLAVLLADNTAGGSDYAAAADWFRRAGELGLRDSQYNLGILHARGMGVPQDMGESYKWFAIAAAAGDTEAKAKADELARRMDPQTVAQAKIAAGAWKPRPLDELANATDMGDAPWNRETTASIPLGGPALIQEAQKLLAGRGYDAGEADGIVGRQTREAVLAFQRDAGLEANGKIDPFLIDALRKQPR